MLSKAVAHAWLEIKDNDNLHAWLEIKNNDNLILSKADAYMYEPLLLEAKFRAVPSPTDLN